MTEAPLAELDDESACAHLMRMATRISHRDESPRRPTNVSLPSDIVAAAKAFGINLSKACEAGLVAEVKRERERRWKDDNREAIEAMNRWYEENGDPLAHLRPL